MSCLTTQSTFEDTKEVSEAAESASNIATGSSEGASLEVKAVPRAEPTGTTLQDAINSAPLTQLRRLLIEITNMNAEARGHASTRLLTSIPGKRGKRKAFETCIKCDADYHVNDNGPSSCVYHDGDKEVDESSTTWDDFPGEPDDFVDDPDYAEGVIWNCCDKALGSEGCVKERHQSKVEPATKRGRMDVASLMN